MDLSEPNNLDSFSNSGTSVDESAVEHKNSSDLNLGVEVYSDCNAVEVTHEPTVSTNTEKKDSCEENPAENITVYVANVRESPPKKEELNDASPKKAGNGELSKVEVIVSKPLCADYESDHEGEFECFEKNSPPPMRNVSSIMQTASLNYRDDPDSSVDSESDSSTSLSSTSETVSSSEDESTNSLDSGTGTKKSKTNKNQSKMDLLYDDLPLIEELKISVPEEACVEIGIITSIVDKLVVVESFKDSAALDVDTVLFLDNGKRTLGKVFDILGPINEPVYTVRFNNEEQIQSLNIKKFLKVYYAPKTQHTNFVFMSEVLKNRGSDASWKDNIEAPVEFQDFSDDEEERRHKSRLTNGEDPKVKDQSKRKKKSPKRKQPFQGVPVPPSRFREPTFCEQYSRLPFQRNPPFVGPPPQMLFPIAQPPPCPPSFYYPLRFSRPPFPAFRGFPYHQQFPQQTTQFYHQRPDMWGRPLFRPLVPPPPPPPPPPPADQGNQSSRS